MLTPTTVQKRNRPSPWNPTLCARRSKAGPAVSRDVSIELGGKGAAAAPSGIPSPPPPGWWDSGRGKGAPLRPHEAQTLACRIQFSKVRCDNSARYQENPTSVIARSYAKFNSFCRMRGPGCCSCSAPPRKGSARSARPEVPRTPRIPRSRNYAESDARFENRLRRS